MLETTRNMNYKRAPYTIYIHTVAACDVTVVLNIKYHIALIVWYRHVCVGYKHQFLVHYLRSFNTNNNVIKFKNNSVSFKITSTMEFHIKLTNCRKYRVFNNIL